MRMTGLSEFIDPCGTSAMPASRSWRICFVVQRRQLDAVQEDAAAVDAAGRADHAQDRQRHGGFAGAGFAGQAEPLARCKAEADAVDRAHRAQRVGVGHAQVA